MRLGLPLRIVLRLDVALHCIAAPQLVSVDSPALSLPHLVVVVVMGLLTLEEGGRVPEVLPPPTLATPLKAHQRLLLVEEMAPPQLWSERGKAWVTVQPPIQMAQLAPRASLPLRTVVVGHRSSRL